MLGYPWFSTTPTTILVMLNVRILSEHGIITLIYSLLCLGNKCFWESTMASINSRRKKILDNIFLVRKQGGCQKLVEFISISLDIGVGRHFKPFWVLCLLPGERMNLVCITIHMNVLNNIWYLVWIFRSFTTVQDSNITHYILSFISGLGSWWTRKIEDIMGNILPRNACCYCGDRQQW